MAGGCVRDALLNKPPKDYDVATNATPESVREVFGKSRTLAFGASFGVIGVLPSGHRKLSAAGQKVEPIEVATFRSDGEYSDGRRPDSVQFGDAEQDALRRDFTINGLFYDPTTDQIVDYVDGQHDLEAQVLRTIGSPTDRFGEDKLRMLRAVRFATTLGFRMDEATQRAIVEHSSDITVVSSERIGAEMRRVLTDRHAAKGLQHLIDTQLAPFVLPEIESVDRQRFASLASHEASASFPFSLACLLVSQTADGDKHHALQAITERWRLSNEEVRRVSSALSHWSTIAQAASLGWSQVQPVLIDRDVAFILELAAAIVQSDAAPETAGVELVREALAWSPEKLNPPTLITGDDLKTAGIPAGPHYRELLQCVRDQQLDGTILTRDQAMEAANEMFSNNSSDEA